MCIKKPTPEQIMKALQDGNRELNLLDELIATSEAAFSLIRFTDVDYELKHSFLQLEKRFGFYARLLRANED
ncbi:MAG: hypothetical protein NTW29_19835 [Bacteroidetes bacterium]|nr:hypothetical protein [Bacteroidota bacterium]